MNVVFSGILRNLPKVTSIETVVLSYENLLLPSSCMMVYYSENYAVSLKLHTEVNFQDMILLRCIFEAFKIHSCSI